MEPVKEVTDKVEKKVCCRCKQYKQPKCKKSDIFVKRKGTCADWEKK